MAFATAAVMDMELRHIDFEQAYLLVDVDTEFYIELPEEYLEFPDAEGKLSKAIYGLVQAGISWNMRLTDNLKTLGFEQSRADPCVFPMFVARKTEAILVVYVNDLLALTVTKEATETFVGELRSMFKIKDLGEASYCMSCHITRDRAKKELKFAQHLYARTITERLGIDKTAMAPATAGLKALSKGHGPKTPSEKKLMTKIPYREAVGALMWTSTMGRPDISRTVHTVAKFFESPGMAHWKAIVKILQYVRRTPERGITYSGDGNGRTVKTKNEAKQSKSKQT